MIEKKGGKRCRKTTAVVIFCGCLWLSQPLSAQFGGLLVEYQADDPRYLAENAVTTNSAFLTLLNNQGAEGKFWLGPRVFFDFSDFSSQDNVELFGCDLDDPRNYQYRLIESNNPDDANAFLAEVNSQGAEGFEFQGNFVLSDGSGGAGQPQAMIFANESGPAQTFEYQLLPASLSLVDTATFNAQGAVGWRWIGPIFFGSDFFDFYIRRPGRNETFSYLQEVAAQSRSAFLAQINAQGTEGQRWKGNFIPIDNSNPESIAVFVQNSQENFSYNYDSLPSQSTRSTFIDQLNAEGSAGAYFRSEFAFQNGDDFDFQAIYTERTGGGGRILLRGIFIFQNEEELAFTPEEAGEFQLFQSSDLIDYQPVGASRTSMGETLTWTIDRSSAPSRYYRIERE